jgi:site-specific recombinase XerD
MRLNLGDDQPQFGLRRVLGKGGRETTVPLPDVARAIVTEYLAKERPGAAASEPSGSSCSTNGTAAVMSGQRVWKIIRDLGKRIGPPREAAGRLSRTTVARWRIAVNERFFSG